MWEGKFWPTSGVVRIYKLSPTLLQMYFTRAHNEVKFFLIVFRGRSQNTFTRIGG